MEATARKAELNHAVPNIMVSAITSAIHCKTNTEVYRGEKLTLQPSVCHRERKVQAPLNRHKSGDTGDILIPKTETGEHQESGKGRQRS